MQAFRQAGYSLYLCLLRSLWLKFVQTSSATNLMLERVEELGLVNQAVDDLLILPLPLEGAEHTVPDDQDAGIVLVQAVAVGAWKRL